MQLNNFLRTSAFFFILFLLPTVSLGMETAQAFLEPYRTAELSSPERAKIEKIYVKEGELVEADLILADFNTDVLQARLQLSTTAVTFHGDVDAAHALVKMRSSKLQTLLKLGESGNARPQEVTTATTNLAIAKAQHLDALERRQLRKAEQQIIIAQIEKNRVYSPFAGTVVKINKQEGELIGIDNEPIMTLVQLNPLLAVFHLPPARAFELKPNNQVLLNIGESDIQAKVENVAPLIDAQSGTVAVRLIIPNPDNKFISGSRAMLLLSQQQELHDDNTSK